MAVLPWHCSEVSATLFYFSRSVHQAGPLYTRGGGGVIVQAAFISIVVTLASLYLT